MEKVMTQKYRAGYLFKISHTEIHYLRNRKIDRRRKYHGNFTTNKHEAFLFNKKEDFEAHIQTFLDWVNSGDSNHDYYFTMVHELVSD